MILMTHFIDFEQNVNFQLNRAEIIELYIYIFFLVTVK